MEKQPNGSEPLYVDINPDNPITEIQSLCMNCLKEGTTRIMPTNIPYFKEVIIMGFTCPHCGFKSSEVEPGGDLPDQGVNFNLKVSSEKDLNRQVIKSNFATINLPGCGLEIPPTTQKGKLSTIEGFLSTARDNFKESLDSGYYSEMGEEFINKITSIVEYLTNCVEGKNLPFEFILDDPSGRSFIENPFAPQTDQGITLKFYERTKEQLEAMGYSVENQIQENKEIKETKGKSFVDPSYYDKKKDFTVFKSNSELSNKIIDFTKTVSGQEDKFDTEAIVFPSNCYCCGAPGEVRCCSCEIPYFKEILISCFKCTVCGYKTTDVKGGGGISEKGLKLTLKVQTKDDLNRDLFKSDTASINIPEVGLETQAGSLGGMFTTVEGILEKIYDNLKDTPFMKGDSSEKNEVFEKFLERLNGLRDLKEPFTLIIDDPAANSFIFATKDGVEDKGLIKEEYERTYEQNEELGINDMKTE
ncbi:MAG: ZPR1-type zinc finger protein [archaeon]|nr:ZPR1-type zinc finger protein [archaeon]